MPQSELHGKEYRIRRQPGSKEQVRADPFGIYFREYARGFCSRLSEVQAHECESLPLRLVRLALLQVRRKNPGGVVMGWMALILAFDGFLTKVSHPEAAGYIYIAAGLFAIADSIANWRNKS